MAIRKIILHAGLPKTATTSLQGALFAGRESLLEQCGIFYPGAEPNHTNALCTAFLDDPRQHITNKTRGMTDLDVLLAEAAAIRERFAEEIRAADPQVVLFSAEGMSNLSRTELGKFREWAAQFCDQIEVLYYVRNPIRYTTSVMQQHIKGGEVLDNMYFAPPLGSFRGRLTNAIRAFGRENVAVHTFEDMVRHPGGISTHFLHAIGVENEKVITEVREKCITENESMSQAAALILSSLNRQRPLFVDGQRAQRRTFSELATISQIKGAKFSLPDEVVDRIILMSLEDIGWLSATFGITAYDDLAADSSAGPVGGFDPQTIDSLAIILSDLLNERQSNKLMAEARRHHQNGEKEGMERAIAEMRRITPNRAVPPFAARVES